MMFKKFSLVTVFLACFLLNCISQNITNYTFAQYSQSAFTFLSGATPAPAMSGNTDDGYWNAIPIGFNFWYMGTRYTTVSASTNGWLTFDANITVATSYANNLSAGNAAALRPTLAPLWDDLGIQASTNLTYLTTGTAGSQIFTLQFLNTKWNYQAGGYTMSFQVKLYESTGKIEYLYKRETGALYSASASIGITATSTGSGNFLSVNNAGTGVSSTTGTSITSKPTNLNIYSFTPPVPAAPGSLTFSGIATTSMTLNWSDLSTNENGFLIYQSIDGITYNLITQTAANTTTSLQSGLTVNTTYYWKICAISEGALSTALSGIQATTCIQPAPPTVTSPLNYCQNFAAPILNAAGSNLLWGGAAGSVGGTGVLNTTTYLDNSYNNKKTNFTTAVANVKITTVDYYIPAYQAVNGFVLSLYNSVGALVATSTTNTTLSANASPAKIVNSFNYTIVAAGDYSIGVSAGSGNIGSDNPGFPITEASGTINITGVSSAGNRCFNNIQFTAGTSSTAPTPATVNSGTTNYLVTQTVSGCVSLPATI
ncbi:MAG: fibronectin type III domain-containing protein, partial [Ferruginibacter sp.]